MSVTSASTRQFVAFYFLKDVMGKALFLIFGGILILLMFGDGFNRVLGFILILAGICYIIWRVLVGAADESKGKQWMESFKTSQYKFAHGDFGIAVDQTHLHLCEDGYTKAYKFEDVRSWKTNLETGGNIVYGGGSVTHAFAVGSANRTQEKNNEKNTGLFVTVRDIDKPVWRIRFSDDADGEKRQQARWFEILNQTLNENAAASVESSLPESFTQVRPSALKAPGSHRFCQSCGTKNGRDAAFCEGCGTGMTRPDH